MLLQDMEFPEDLSAPIGDDETPFVGHLDGAGFAIHGVRLEDSDNENVGLFGQIGVGGVVERLTLEDLFVRSTRIDTRVGGLVGTNQGEIVEVLVTGQVGATGESSRAGGVAGVSTESGEILGSRASAIVVSTFHGGGLVGTNEGEIDGSSSSDTVMGQQGLTLSAFGGLVGSNLGRVRRSWSDVSVTGARRIGGFVGINSGEIFRSFARGSTTTARFSGGFVAWNRSDGEIQYSYSTTAVGGLQMGITGERFAGGFAGYNNGTIGQSYSAGTIPPFASISPAFAYNAGDGATAGCYWDEDLTSATDDSGATPLGTDDFEFASNFLGWDFTSTWQYFIDDDPQRPRLQWEEDE